MRFDHFKEVKFFTDKDDGLAKSLRSKGQLLINLYWWKKIPAAHRIFVLLHEEGHIVLNTRDELVSDQYASERYLAEGLPQIESIRALTHYLKKENPVHNTRAWAQYQRVLKNDYEKFKNLKSYRARYNINLSEIKNQLQNAQRLR